MLYYQEITKPKQRKRQWKKFNNTKKNNNERMETIAIIEENPQRIFIERIHYSYK